MSISSRDKQYIWHPLNQHKTHPTSIGITKSQGVYLFDEDGNKYIDGISSWYTAMYGHCNPFIIKRVQDQLEQLNQIIFSGFTHEPAVKLSEKLMEILPNNQAKIFFSDNGSTAVEIGIKIALQYWSNKGIKRNKIIAFNQGFHGDTFGAMAASGESIYNRPFKDLLLKVDRILPPTSINEEYVLEHLQKLINKGDVAALVYEPLVQGAAGMKMHDAQSLEKVLALCKKNNILLVADEVMTGFGKTGKHFASDWMETKPDIMCLSKALSAGVVPLAVTSCAQHIYDAFYSDDVNKGFFHAHTYSANPVACSAAIAGIELLQSKEIQDNIKQINKLNKQFLTEIKETGKVKNCREIGVIAAFDLAIESNTMYNNLRDTLYKQLMDQGVYLRPLGNTIYIVPPYIINEEELNSIYTAIKKVVRDIEL